MRSFITSYLPATESNTPRTRFALSSASTSSKPKCVRSLIAEAWGCSRLYARKASRRSRSLAMQRSAQTLDATGNRVRHDVEVADAGEHVASLGFLAVQLD